LHKCAKKPVNRGGGRLSGRGLVIGGTCPEALVWGPVISRAESYVLNCSCVCNCTESRLPGHCRRQVSLLSASSAWRRSNATADKTPTYARLHSSLYPRAGFRSPDQPTATELVADADEEHCSIVFCSTIVMSCRKEVVTLYTVL